MADDTGTTEAVTEAVTETPSAPLLRVVNPDATPEEIAAIVAVLASLGGGAAPAPARRPEWSAPHRLHRTTLPSGPAGWRSSSLPR